MGTEVDLRRLGGTLGELFRTSKEIVLGGRAYLKRNAWNRDDGFDLASLGKGTGAAGQYNCERDGKCDFHKEPPRTIQAGVSGWLGSQSVGVARARPARLQR